MKWNDLTNIILLLICCGGVAMGEGKSSVCLQNNRLVYTPDARGNTVPDFSRCGYMGGGVALPNVPVRLTLQPLPGDADDTERIQQAIDRVSQEKPDRNGFRGAVLLQHGTYRVNGSLQLNVSGVVLRGEGQGPDGTVLLATGKQKRTLISMKGNRRLKEIKNSRRQITSPYVPWGEHTLCVESARGYREGQAIVVVRPGTDNWIEAIGMNRIAERDGTYQWRADDYSLSFERTVTAVHGNRITLDAPLVQALEEVYGGGYVYAYEEEGTVSQVGVEHLCLISEYEKGKEESDERHAWTGISLGTVNSWVRNVTTVHFSHTVNVNRDARFTTVQDCANLRPVSKVDGGRRYPFAVSGQFGLVQRCYTDRARHAQLTSSRVCGPNVFLDCFAENTLADTGPHQRWAVGILWDNLKGGEFNARDRGNMGSGHGWAGAQQVFWNCETSSICVQQPPTAQNYAIGCLGKISPGHLQDRTPGRYESHGKHVEPRSLYLKQLEERMGPAAVKQIASDAQLQGTIYDELKQQFYFELQGEI